MALPIFTPAELELLARATRVSQELAGQYFALPDAWFDDTSHRVCTVRDLRRDELLGCGQLAQIRRVLRLVDGAPVLRCRRICPHYRICLQDHNLVPRARRDPGVDLESLLTCVLTHEYVHLIRFSRHQHPYQADADRRAAEERRVDAITGEIVSRLGHDRLRRVGRRLAAGTAAGRLYEGSWPGPDLDMDAPEHLVDLPKR